MILPWRWSNGRSPGSLAPAVRAQGINFAYGWGDARPQVLFDISIEIPPGQFAVMTGPSGSGKTTLLTVIGGLTTMPSPRPGASSCGASTTPRSF